jgi:hypothetical protein
MTVMADDVDDDVEVLMMPFEVVVVDVALSMIIISTNLGE